jgi:hypothetical protein
MRSCEHTLAFVHQYPTLNIINTYLLNVPRCFSFGTKRFDDCHSAKPVAVKIALVTTGNKYCLTASILVNNNNWAISLVFVERSFRLTHVPHFLARIS